MENQGNQAIRPESGQVLNSFLIAILWIKLAFTSLGILGQLWEFIKDADSIDPVMVTGIVLAICAVLGVYLLLKVEKTGFYLIVAADIAIAILSYYRYTHISASEYGMVYSFARELAFKGVWSNIGQIILLMLLMLLKRDGKNAYQVLWGSDNQPESAL